MSRASRQPKFRWASGASRRASESDHRTAAPAGARRRRGGARDRAPTSAGSGPTRRTSWTRRIDAPPAAAAPRAASEPGQAVGRGGRLGDTGEAPDEGLARGADGDGKPERARRPPRWRSRRRLPSGLLPKPRPGSMAIASAATPASAARSRGVGEERGDVGRADGRSARSSCIVRGSVPFMCMRIAPAPAAAIVAEHAGIEAPRRDVVDEVRAGLERRARDGGLARVDRERRVRLLARMRVDDRDDARDLLLGRERPGLAVGRRPRRLAADVHDRRALLEHRERARDGRAPRSKWRPPSEKESGVTLTTPMTTGPAAKVEGPAAGEREARRPARGPLEGRLRALPQARRQGLERLGPPRARDDDGPRAEPSKRTTSTGKSEAGRSPAETRPRRDLAERLGVGGGEDEVGRRETWPESSGSSRGREEPRRRSARGAALRDLAVGSSGRSACSAATALPYEAAGGHVMKVVAWIVALASLAPPAPAAQKSEARLAELAAAVLTADYRGDRAELARARRGARPASTPGALDDYRDYWRGFALLAAGDERLQRDADAGRPRRGPREGGRRASSRRSRGGRTGSRRGSRWSAAGAT